MLVNQIMSPAGTIGLVVEPENKEGQDVPDTIFWTATPDGYGTLVPDVQPSLACSFIGNGTGTPLTPVVIKASDGTINDYVTVTFTDNVPSTLNMKVLNGPT